MQIFPCWKNITLDIRRLYGWKNVRTQNLCCYKIKRFKQRCLINLQNRDQTQKEPDNNENACLASSVQDWISSPLSFMHNNPRKNSKNRDSDSLHISKYYGILLWCEGFLLCCDDVFRQREPSKK